MCASVAPAAARCGAGMSSNAVSSCSSDSTSAPQRAAAGATEAHTRFGALAYFLTQQEGGRSAPITTGYRPQLLFGTMDVAGGVELAIATRAMPGDQAEIEVTLTTAVALEPGTRFSIREGGRTVAAGVVTDVLE